MDIASSQPTKREPGDEGVISATKQWVLVAEDDREMLRLLSKVLKVDGFDVVEAGSGLELFDTLRQSKTEDDLPTLVVSDIRMPGLTGLQVLRTIREWGLSMPVILITAFPDEETIAEASECGAAAVLAKPFDIDDLRTATRYLVDHPDRSSALRL